MLTPTRSRRDVVGRAGEEGAPDSLSSSRPDPSTLKASELRDVLKALGAPTAGKKAELVQRARDAWAMVDRGQSPAEEFAREAEETARVSAEASAAMESRRAARRARRGGKTAAAGGVDDASSSARSIADTTREVAAMKDAGVTEIQREFVVQRFMSDSVEASSGWFMLETAESREDRAVNSILELNGTKLTRGQADIVAWVPRVPRDGFFVRAADAEGKSDLELCQMVTEEEMSEMLQPGYVLVRCTLTQMLLDAFDELRTVRGFATGGSSRFGAKKYQQINQPLTMDDQIPQMIAKCLPRVLSDEDIEVEKARDEAREIARDAADDEADGEDLRPLASRVVEDSTAGGLGRVEVHTGPFKGFKGRIVTKNDDGSVEATLAIFGRDTNVSLAPNEFNEV
jgi:transcription antitermination factor NusG